MGKMPINEYHSTIPEDCGVEALAAFTHLGWKLKDTYLENLEDHMRNIGWLRMGLEKGMQVYFHGLGVGTAPV